MQALVSYVVALEEGQVQVVGHMLCDGRLAACRGACEEEDVAWMLCCWLLTHCDVSRLLQLPIDCSTWYFVKKIDPGAEQDGLRVA